MNTTTVVNPHPALVFFMTVAILGAFTFGVYKIYLFGYSAHDRYVRRIIQTATEKAAARVEVDMKKPHAPPFSQEELFLAVSHYANHLDSCIMTMQTVNEMTKTN